MVQIVLVEGFHMQWQHWKHLRGSNWISVCWELTGIESDAAETRLLADNNIIQK